MRQFYRQLSVGVQEELRVGILVDRVLVRQLLSRSAYVQGLLRCTPNWNDLEGPQWWVPGRAVKVNWEVEKPTGAENSAPVLLWLRRHGSERDEYALELQQLGPSTVSFPGPGYWVLTMERAGERAETTLFIRRNTPRALVLSERDGAALAPGSARGDPVLSDIAPLLQVLERAEWRPAPVALTGIRLDLVWESGWHEPMLYIPRRNGEGPLLVVARRLLVGRCDEVEYVAIPLPDLLARRIDQKTQGAPETRIRDLPEFGGTCMPFLSVN